MTDSAADRAAAAAQGAHDSPWMDRLARAGLVAYGVVHLLIAWVAVQLAWGETRRAPSSKGALRELGAQPLGGMLVWAVALGLIALVLWRLTEAAVGHQTEDGADRVKKRATSAGKAVLYAVMALAAVKVATGDNSGGGPSMTKRAMDLPAGQWLVALAGLSVIGYGGYLVHRGLSEKFMEKLDHEGRGSQASAAYRWIGKAGYAAKGLSIAIVGILLTWAGFTHDAGDGGGLDDALRTVLDQPFGPYLLSLISIGLACYGLFSIVRARHLDR